ncbi:copper chaperone PCu(A)C [Roseivivax marinus]|uniref:copper chaperone PCu(A)C n=1 Tax=Roseivivax marinus TaxID=1379903 RepID=UPI001F042388|nr:copper chaperone PCu(A)C [Roseivivax marinus]UMA65395.1 copper chaperone PCu(A)C [Roseivivax marinus]
MIRTLSLAATLVAGTAAMATADIIIHDAYARSATPVAKSGAAFMVIENDGAEADRLIGVASEAAAVVELHTHAQDDTGMMLMRPVEGGLEIPADGSHALQRGGDHVMFMGLTEGWENGDTIPVTLTFERAGDVQVDIVVDRDRQPAQDGGHGAMQGMDTAPTN